MRAIAVLLMMTAGAVLTGECQTNASGTGAPTAPAPKPAGGEVQIGKAASGAMVAPADIDVDRIWVQGHQVLPGPAFGPGKYWAYLNAAEAIGDLNGRCLYQLTYRLHNSGGTTTGRFGVAIRIVAAGAPTVPPQGAFSLAPGGSQVIKTTLSLASGDQEIIISVDPSDAVPEKEAVYSNWDGSPAPDGNDYGFPVHVFGQCEGKPSPASISQNLHLVPK